MRVVIKEMTIGDEEIDFVENTLRGHDAEYGLGCNRLSHVAAVYRLEKNKIAWLKERGAVTTVEQHRLHDRNGTSVCIVASLTEEQAVEYHLRWSGVND